MSGRHNAYHRKCWIQHKASAKQRGIGFHLSYGDWMRIWRASGHLHQRGVTSSAYVMGRLGDVGPYASSNVAIITQHENLLQAAENKRRRLTAAST